MIITSVRYDNTAAGKSEKIEIDTEDIDRLYLCTGEDTWDLMDLIEDYFKLRRILMVRCPIGKD